VAQALPTDVTLPKDWPRAAKSGFLCAISLGHRAMTVAQSWCVNSRIARVRLAADNARLTAEVAMLREELRIKDARLSRIPPASRPHYPPTERLAILALKAARGWNNAQAARAFLVTADTIASWLSRVDEQGPAALVKLPTPINRFPDFVDRVVQSLKITCPLMGKARIAQVLARAGLHLSPSTVRRMLKRPAPGPIPSTPCPIASSTDTSTSVGLEKPKGVETLTPKRVVTARYPHHVLHVDLTVVPTSLGFWIPWFPNALGQHWPFCYWVAVVVDHFSRKALVTHSFRTQPSAANVTSVLDTAIAIAGRRPKYVVTDKGPQFQEEYRGWCAARTSKPRFGAVGQHGSIAIVERFIRSLKDECTRRIVVPLAPKAFDTELLFYLDWYNEHRPHQSLAGRTPNEVYDGARPARDGPRFETKLGLLQASAEIGSVEPMTYKVTTFDSSSRRSKAGGICQSLHSSVQPDEHYSVALNSSPLLRSR
jgi:transposase InsO family protein